MTTSLTRTGNGGTTVFPSLVSQFFDDSLFGPWLSRREDRPWFPAVDLSQTPDKFLVKVDLPGMTKKDINVTVENQTLTISGERKFENAAEGETYNRIERGYGAFSRSFHLPANVDATRVAAHFKDGVLSVEIPKSEEAKSRTVEIK